MTAPHAMRILVTGGDGFIGSHVVEALAERGHDVLSYDSLLPGAHRGAPPDRDAKAEHRVGDIRDEDRLLEALRGVDAVCHQAAMVGLGVDLNDVVEYVSHNDLGTAVLLRAMHRIGFEGRIVLASSMVVYGEGSYRCGEHGTVRPGARDPADLLAGRFEPGCPTCAAPLTPASVPEDASTDPRSVYAATKLHQEHLCAAYTREHDAPLAMLRYHNVYGPRMPRDTPYAGVASIFRSAVARGESPRVLEDGGQLRDFVHVRDVARANILALESIAAGVFNIASGHPRTVHEMARTLAASVDPDAPLPIVVGGARSGDVRHIFASPAKAYRELGFSAQVGFEDGMAAFARAPMRPIDHVP